MTSPTDIYGTPLQRTRTVRSFSWQPTVAIVGTGLVTAVGVAVNLAFMADNAGTITLTTGALTAIYAAILVSLCLGYAAMLTWMYAARTRLIVGGYPAPARWKVWAGWLIPFYGLWAPFSVVRTFRVRVKSASEWNLRMWWAGWLVYSLLDRVIASPSITGDVQNSVFALEIAAVVASYVGLVITIQEVKASFAPASVSDPVVA